MGVLTRSLDVVKKSLSFHPLTSNAWSYVGLSDERGYSTDVGDGSNSSLVEACVLWIAKQFTATDPTVRRYDSVSDSDFGELDRSHPAGRLVRRPTFEPRIGRSYYSWHPLIQATITSLTVDGNAYWRKRRSAIGLTVQLWYLPHWMVEPKRDDRSQFFVDYYEVRAGAQVERVRPEDIIHFRDGLDSNNPLLGVSPLRTLLREIFTDEEAARWTASLLKKQGVPGIVLAPDTGAAPPSEEEAKLIKERLMADFTGDRRGEPMVLGAPTKIHQYGFSPEQMKLGEIRDIPEERVSAVLGIPAAVAGFGSGLQTAKVGATMGELIDLGWQNGVLPRARLIAAELTEQLLPDFGDSERVEFVFDTSNVPIMADYQAKIAEKHERLVRSSIELKSEARRAVGLKATKDDEVYMVQAGVVAVLPDGKPQVEPPKPPPQPPTVVAGPPDPALPAPQPKALTDRQQDIAELMDSGVVQKQIAADIGISERTVEREVAVIREWRKMAEGVV